MPSGMVNGVGYHYRHLIHPSLEMGVLDGGSDS